MTEPNHHPPTPLTHDDLTTTIRVLRTIDAFQESMQSSASYRGGLGFKTEYQSALQPAAETIQNFSNWFTHLTPQTPSARR